MPCPVGCRCRECQLQEAATGAAHGDTNIDTDGCPCGGHADGFRDTCYPHLYGYGDPDDHDASHGDHNPYANGVAGATDAYRGLGGPAWRSSGACGRIVVGRGL